MRTAFILILSLGIGMAQQVLVAPYIQPGDAPSLDREEKVILWQTDNQPAEFKVEYGTTPRSARTAPVQAINLNTGTESRLYSAVLKDLRFDTTYHYRVLMNGKPIMQSKFRTRTRRSSLRFVVFGDSGAGSPEQAQIAYQSYKTKPDFILVTGDNVYSRGQMREYLERFFPYYNPDQASPEKGAPLLRSIPFYLAIGNHDVGASDLGKYPDGLACFYYFSLPLNGPLLKQPLTAAGSEAQVEAFKGAAGARFPRMCNYSFDYGNVHLVCLDANGYANLSDPELSQWLEKDLQATKATWKIVAFHHPGFHSSRAHYNDQRMRVLAPLFERLGVDLVMNGHVHNYQRSKPLRFQPVTDANGKPIIAENGRVNGTFMLDTRFDGVKQTRANGVIYIVSGAGGKGLYDREMSNKPDTWTHESENWAPFTVKLVSDVHSFTLVEVKERRLTLRQIDVNGRKLDEITLTK